MKTCPRVFINWEYNNWTMLLPITKFFYNSAKNASTNHNPFKLNCEYYLRVFFEENVDSHSQSRSINKLAEKEREPIEICCQNLLHAQKL